LINPAESQGVLDLRLVGRGGGARLAAPRQRFGEPPAQRRREVIHEPPVKVDDGQASQLYLERLVRRSFFDARGGVVMRVNCLAGAMVLAATLFSAGCGMDEDVSSPMESVEESEAVVWCSNKSWRVNFYAEPERITLVGWLACQCYRPQTSGGTYSDYTSLVFERVCEPPQ
jgi:hypothetical protein